MQASRKKSQAESPTKRPAFFWQRTRAAAPMRFAAALLSAISLACGPGGPKQPRCEDAPRDDQPRLAPLGKLAPSGGSVSFEARLPTKEIVRLVDAAIPRVLASAKNRPIGAAGQVTFRAVRRRPEIFVDGSTLGLVLPVEIDISMCKPFGSLCVGYGKCRPRYDVEVRVAVRPDGALVFPKPDLRAEVREGCVIAVDVTEHVTRIVEGELRKIRPVLAQAPALLTDQLERSMKNLARPLALPTGACAFATPTTVRLAPLRLEAGMLELGATLGVELSGDVACDDRREPPALPTLGEAPGAPSAPLVLVETIPAATIETRVLELLRGTSDAAPGEPRATHVTGAHVELGADAIAILAELTGERCGTVWLRAVPRVEDGALVLSEVTVLGAGRDDAALSPLRARLEGAPLTPVRSIAWAASEPWKDDVLAALPEAAECGISAQISGPTAPLRTQASGVLLPGPAGARGGIGVAVEFDATFGVELRGKPTDRSCTLLEGARLAPR